MVMYSVMSEKTNKGNLLLKRTLIRNFAKVLENNYLIEGYSVKIKNRNGRNRDPGKKLNTD